MLRLLLAKQCPRPDEHTPTQRVTARSGDRCFGTGLSPGIGVQAFVTFLAVTLTLQRCLHHPAREAVARCPECTGFFCRECITEHEDRVICAECLAKIAQAGVRQKKSHRLPLAGAGMLAQMAAGTLMAWFAFYLLGRMLLSLPSAFHTDTLWEAMERLETVEINE